MKFWKNAPKSDRRLFKWSAGVTLLAVSLLAFRTEQIRAKSADDEEFLRFVDTAAEIYNEIRNKYVDEVEGKDVLEGALQGMFTRLDEHSQYMDPRTLDGLNKDTGGEFSGIGIHITMRQGLLTVIAPMTGSPSAALGIMPWDRIIEIDGKTTEGLTLQEAVDKLTGPAGTTVRIKVFREGEAKPIDYEITRASIKVNSVYHELREGGVGYIRVARFSENTAADVRKAIFDMKSQGMKSVIMDLRFNPGGLLREAVELSELWVPKSDMIVSTKGRQRSQNKEYRSSADPIVTEPTFVLVNEGSASASEIFAGAMQDHHLGVIIGPAGKNTFGKGSVQTIESLRHSMYDDENGNPKESALRLTTARYYVPSGRTIHHIGVTPDIGVPLPEGAEADLLRHGLLGDTTIPLTAEEQKAIDEAKMKRDGNIKEAPSDAPTDEILLQTPTDELDETTIINDSEPAKSKDGKPFYSGAKKPQLADEKPFTDLLLDEAIKQMKTYMILNEKNSGTKITAEALKKESDLSVHK